MPDLQMNDWIALILIGLIAGWVASMVVNRHHNIFVNLIIGLIGSFIGAFVVNMTHIVLPLPSFWSHLVVSIGGAIILLLVLSLFGKRRA